MVLWSIYFLQRNDCGPRILDVITRCSGLQSVTYPLEQIPPDEVENDAGNQDGEVSRSALPFLRRDDSRTGQSCKQASLAEAGSSREFRGTQFPFIEFALPCLPKGEFLQDYRCR